MASAVAGDASRVDPNANAAVTVPDDGDTLNASSVSDSGTAPETGFTSTIDWIEWLRENSTSLMFGPGTDGAAAFNGSGTVTGASGTGPYTLTRDVFYTNVTISAGVTINTAGFRMYANGILSNAAGTGTIQCNGGNGGSGLSGGAAGTRPGTSGVLGADAGGAGSAGTGGGNSTSQSVTVGLGGRGGDGGAGTSGTPGTSTITAPTAAQGSIRLPQSILTGLLYGASGALPVQGGTGGTGGTGSGGGTNGGGAGGAGGVALVAARVSRLAASTVIRAIGGNGGAGDVSGGGGGGGGGGAVIYLSRDVFSGSTAPAAVITATSVAAGTGGAGGAGGAAGSNGFVGNFYITRS